MKKINRRTFFKRAGVAAVSFTMAPYAKVSAAHTDKGTSPVPISPIAPVSDEGKYFSAKPADNGKALINPLMGWTMHFYSNILTNYGSQLVPSDTVDDFPGLTTVYLRVPWAFLEPEEGHFVWELIDTPAQRWIDKGKYVAFRISAMESWMYYATPKWVFDAGAVGYDVEGNYKEPDYDDPVFLEKVENFITALALRYDNNPHVAFVDVGSYGMWGEGHTVMTTPKHGHSWGFDTQKKHIDLHLRHFHSTQLCISDDFAGHDAPGQRFPITDYAFQHGVTLRDDSILVQPYPRCWYHSEMAQLFWPKMPVVLEHEHYGSSLARKAWDKELLLKSIEDYHASFMSVHWWPRQELNDNRDIIERINRRMGYRLQLLSVSWPKSVHLGEEFELRSAWRNAAVAPCYKGGFPCFTLKDSLGGIVSALVVDSFNVLQLSVAEPGKSQPLEAAQHFRIAPRYTDSKGTFFRACNPGTYSLYISVGMRDGTPIYELPYNDHDGKRRYLLGKITITE